MRCWRCWVGSRADPSAEHVHESRARAGYRRRIVALLAAWLFAGCSTEGDSNARGSTQVTPSLRIDAAAQRTGDRVSVTVQWVNTGASEVVLPIPQYCVITLESGDAPWPRADGEICPLPSAGLRLAPKAAHRTTEHFRVLPAAGSRFRVAVPYDRGRRLHLVVFAT